MGNQLLKSYRNCLLWLGEKYPNHSFHWHPSYCQDAEYGLIEKVKIQKSKIELWLNVPLFLRSESLFESLKLLLSQDNTSSIYDEVFSALIDTYNRSLFPELVPSQNVIFKNGDMLFSECDYSANTLAHIEQKIRQAFCQNRLSINLYQSRGFFGCILGKVLSGETLKITHYKNKPISGEITFKMRRQESHQVFELLTKQMKDFLYKLGADQKINFSGVKVVFDTGLEVCKIGQILGEDVLVGGVLKEEIL